MKRMLLIFFFFGKDLISSEKLKQDDQKTDEQSIENMILPKSIFTVIPKDENSRLWYLMLTKSGMIRKDAFKIMEEQSLSLDLNPTEEKAVAMKQEFERRLSEDEDYREDQFSEQINWQKKIEDFIKKESERPSIIKTQKDTKEIRPQSPLKYKIGQNEPDDDSD